LQSYLAYLLSRAALGLFGLLPRTPAIRLLNFLAACLYRLDGRHRHIAQVNLQIAFPEMSEQERERIAIRSFQNTARNLLELGHFSRLTQHNVGSLVSYDEVSGLNNFRDAQARGKGILYITGHFSAWELLPVAHALNGYPLCFVTRPLDNTHLERHLLKIRQSTGNKVISKKYAARQILESLKSHQSVGILMDQNTSLNEGIFADFFGIPAATTTSAARLALHTEAAVLPGFITPTGDHGYSIHFLPPLDLVRTGDLKRDIEINTSLFNKTLEQIVRAYPDCWLWGHKRWNYQPAANPHDLYRLSPQDLKAFLARKNTAGACSEAPSPGQAPGSPRLFSTFND
jgi:KDO2-lipid IV(A) lauroyltransferase